jgi:hypothetical protein
MSFRFSIDDDGGSKSDCVLFCSSFVRFISLVPGLVGKSESRAKAKTRSGSIKGGWKSPSHEQRQRTGLN